ncbi:hypothetical protein [Vitiosangium sp. GDMCC 1.1324]|uniref:hypothetical protein n=1 Tax=Vitiosangium sp. (strain GDMCC 1.1324) TaxID=2138576 RepID=UPI000D398B88|nr:hypothetical protein [Vitiosangium sp. GDMCC 1.1324]PTL79287.1 hypothetical protein DAT35_34350 [Vitiosangium sp. GDMCC 1.1324]
MSDSAQGFIVLGAARTKVQRWLGSRRLPAFLAAGPGKALRLWPHVEGEAAGEAADALSRELPKSRVLVFSTRQDTLWVSVHVDGTCQTREEVALRMRTAKQLAQAHAALQRVSTAIDFKGHRPTLLRDGESRPGFLALAGAKEDDIATLSYARLVEARQHPEAPDAVRLQDFSFVDEQGKAHPFFPGTPGQES